MCYNLFGAVVTETALVLLRKEVRLMLEFLLAIGFILICLAIVLHESNKKN